MEKVLSKLKLRVYLKKYPYINNLQTEWIGRFISLELSRSSIL